MTTPVQRFLLTARPARNHRRYKPWETARICIFIQEADKHDALNKLNDILSARRWELLRIERHDLLIEDRLRAEGGEVWAAYENAQKDGYHVSEFPEHFAAGSRQRPSVPP